jgi:hypothetical protein
LLSLLPHYRQYHVTRAAAGLAPDIYPSSRKSLWVHRGRKRECREKNTPFMNAAFGV